MQSLETKSSRPRPKSLETETSKNRSRDASRDRDQVSRLHHCSDARNAMKQNTRQLTFNTWKCAKHALVDECTCFESFEIMLCIFSLSHKWARRPSAASDNSSKAKLCGFNCLFTWQSIYSVKFKKSDLAKSSLISPRHHLLVGSTYSLQRLCNMPSTIKCNTDLSHN